MLGLRAWPSPGSWTRYVTFHESFILDLRTILSRCTTIFDLPSARESRALIVPGSRCIAFRSNLDIRCSIFVRRSILDPRSTVQGKAAQCEQKHCLARSKTHAHATHSDTVHYNAIHYNEPIDPQELGELRDPRDGEPKERFRGTQAGGRKCHRVSFANKRRYQRETSGEDGREISEDTAGRRDERRLGQRRVEGRNGGRERREAGSHSIPRTFWHALHMDRAPQGAPHTAPEKEQVSHGAPRQYWNASGADRAPQGIPLTGSRVTILMAPLRPLRHTLHIHKEFHVRLRGKDSHNVPPCHRRPQARFTSNPPESAHP